MTRRPDIERPVRDDRRTDAAPSPGSLSSPLDLRRRLARPDVRFDLVPFVDCCILALLFGLLNAEFIFSPGLAMDLPESREAAVSGSSATAVLTVRRNMMLFDGAKYTIEALEPALNAFLGSNRAGRIPADETVLLLKMERDVTAQQFLDICEIARAAGFARIQVASEPRTAVLPEGELGIGAAR